MDDAVRLAVCVLLAVPFALLALGNWLTVVGALVEAIRQGKSRTFSLCLPFLGGIAGAFACVVCPWPGAWHWVWLPLLLDPSIGLLLLALVLHVVARIGGLRSPFDGKPA
jgi:hypothetical protein